MSASTEGETHAGGQRSRRRVISGALWTAPVIVMATSAPAAAGSLDRGVLTWANGPLGEIWISGLIDSFTILYQSSSATPPDAPLTGISVLVEVQTSFVAPSGLVPQFLEPSPWVAGSVTSAPDWTSFTLTYAGVVAAGAAAPPLKVWLEGVTGNFTRASKLTAVGHTNVGDTQSLMGNATWSRVIAVPG